MAENNSVILTDTSRDIYEETYFLSASHLGRYPEEKWKVHKKRLKGGKQDGVDIIELDNGIFSFTIIPTRGMNILSASYREISIGWKSPVKEIVHPSFINPDGRGGLGWLEGFNEWLARCGLESFGAPGPDTITDNQGNKKDILLTLHGRISNIPASRFGINVSQRKPSSITVWGEVYEASMFGPNLKLTTSIATYANSNTITVTDTVQNLASTPQEFELLYHTNFGPPLLEEGSRFIAPVKKIIPVNERAKEGLKRYHVYNKPAAGFIEQCYLFEMKSSKKGLTTVLLTNRNKDIASSITYSIKELPCFTLWKSTGALSDGYVTGLEPGTNYPLPRKVEREEGRLLKLRPGQKKTFNLNFSMHAGKKEVRALSQKVEFR